MVSALLFSPAEGMYPSRISMHNIVKNYLYFSRTNYVESPRIITINCMSPSGASSGGLCPTPLVQDHFGSEIAQSIVLTLGINGESLRFPLQIFYSPLGLATGTPVNRPILKITSGAARRVWCGVVVALKYKGTRRSDYTDAGLNDLAALSAYFVQYK